VRREGKDIITEGYIIIGLTNEELLLRIFKCQISPFLIIGLFCN
jgi:hypothetical protein